MATEHMDEPRWEGDPEEGMHFYIGDKEIRPDRFASEPTAASEDKLRKKTAPDRFATAPRSWVGLQPYDADAACPKCGAKGAGTQWRAGTAELRPSRGYSYLDDASGPAEPGWMQRTCNTCGYRWAEAPADAS